jgi:hypothetical protein
MWNEGNLFSLNVQQLSQFISKQSGRNPETTKKSELVKLVEGLLQSKDVGNARAPAQRNQPGKGGRWDAPPEPQLETLLDLTQSGFYEGQESMAPKAFQLMVADSAPDVVVSRVSTTAFPGRPANAEVYTLAGADADVAVRSRFSKAFQWCLMNLGNLQIDAELSVDFGKLLMKRDVIRKNRTVVSAFTIQQRLQVKNPWSWVSCIPERSIPKVEQFLSHKELQPVFSKPQVTYETIIRRSKDSLHVELDSKAKTISVNSPWMDIQSSHLVVCAGADLRFLVRSRAAPKRKDVEQLMNTPVLKIAKEDVDPVLPADVGQVVYVAENESRRWEKTITSGVRLSVCEVKRQPLIVTADEEEDPRTEYTVTVQLPANPKDRVDIRGISLEVFDFCKAFGVEIADDFVHEYGCVPHAVQAGH